MKFFKKQGVALAVLVLSIAAAVCIGQSRKAGYIAKQPVTLPEVKYHQWICDEAGMLSEKTKDEIRQYNSDWDSRYYAAVAVATVDSITGWTPEKAAEKLGADWDLGENDMLLLLVRNGDYYVNCGGKVRAAMTDTQQMKLKQAIETPYYNGDFDGAALAFTGRPTCSTDRPRWAAASAERGGWRRYVNEKQGLRHCRRPCFRLSMPSTSP